MDDELWDELVALAIEPGVMRHQFLGGGLRTVALGKCRACDKWLYASRRAARRNRRHLGTAGHVYRCPETQGWHLTTVTARSVARRRTESLAEE